MGGTKTIVTKRTDAIVEQKDVKSDTTVQAPAPQYHVSVGATIDRIYSVQIEKKVLGPISVGIRAETTGQVAAVLGD